MSDNRDPFRSYCPFDDESDQGDGVEDEIETFSSPLKRSKYDISLVEMIDEGSPLKSTPQEQLVKMIEECETPEKLKVARYEDNPAIEVPSPFKLSPNEVEIIESKDSRRYQVKKEKLRQRFVKVYCEKKTTSEKTTNSTAERFATSLKNMLATTGIERNSFIGKTDELVDDDKEERSHLDLEICEATFSVFGKCIVDGIIVKMKGFQTEDVFVLEDQRVRLVIDNKLASSLGNRLESGRRVRVYHPFSLIQDQRSHFIIMNLFFIKALDYTPSRTLASRVIFKWNCPCRVTEECLVPEIRPEDCRPEFEEIPSQL